MQKGPFYHDKPLTESELYKNSIRLSSFLFTDLITTGLILRPMSEIDPYMTRDSNVDQQATRLIMVDTSTLIMREAYDHDRLNNKLDIDKVLDQFKGSDINNILAVQTFDLFDKIGELTRTKDGEKQTIDTVDADLHCALIAIGFNDPLDILFYLSRDDDVMCCQVMAVSPRPRH